MRTARGRLFALFVLFCLAVLAMTASVQAQDTTPAATPAATSASAQATPSYVPPEATLVSNDPGNLSVLEWAYYDVPDMWADFKAAYPNVQVNFNFGAADPDIFAKTQAGSGEDIIHFYTPWLKIYVDAGLIQPLDQSKLTYWDQIPAQFQDLCTLDGKIYCVPWDWGYTSILYRTDKVTQPVDSWNALFDPQYAGHISMWDSGDGAAEVGAYIRGYDESNLTDAQLADIKQMWIQQRDLNALYWTDEPQLVEAMTSGDVWLAYAWNGAYYSLLNAGVPVAYAFPKEGRNSWVGLYAISSHTQNYDLAMAFLNDKLGPLSGTNLMTEYAYGHVNPNYYGAVTDPNLIAALSLNDPTVLNRTNFTKPISLDNFQRDIQMWAEVKAAP